MLIYTNSPVNVLVQLLGHVVAVNKNMSRNANAMNWKPATYLTTCITLGISRPLAATAVATRIGIRPALKSSKAWRRVNNCQLKKSKNITSTCSLSLWSRSPWMLVAGKPCKCNHHTVHISCNGLKYLLAQVEAEEVRLPLGLHEHQRPLLGVAAILVEDADELVFLLVLGGSVKCLHNICTSPTNESNLNWQRQTQICYLTKTSRCYEQSTYA